MQARIWLARQRSELPADSFSRLQYCSNYCITATRRAAFQRPCNGTDHHAMAGHEASLRRTAVDTVIPMTRSVDKLRTVCGRLGVFAAGGHAPVSRMHRAFPGALLASR